jgi:hypothetical protein
MTGIGVYALQEAFKKKIPPVRQDSYLSSQKGLHYATFLISTFLPSLSFFL